MKFIRFPVKLEFNLRALSLRNAYALGTITGASIRGWNQLLCLDFGDRWIRLKENLREKKFFLEKF